MIDARTRCGVLITCGYADDVCIFEFFVMNRCHRAGREVAGDESMTDDATTCREWVECDKFVWLGEPVTCDEQPDGSPVRS